MQQTAGTSVALRLAAVLLLACLALAAATSAVAPDRHALMADTPASGTAAEPALARTHPAAAQGAGQVPPSAPDAPPQPPAAADPTLRTTCDKHSPSFCSCCRICHACNSTSSCYLNAAPSHKCDCARFQCGGACDASDVPTSACNRGYGASAGCSNTGLLDSQCACKPGFEAVGGTCKPVAVQAGSGSGLPATGQRGGGSTSTRSTSSATAAAAAPGLGAQIVSCMCEAVVLAMVAALVWARPTSAAWLAANGAGRRTTLTVTARRLLPALTGPPTLLPTATLAAISASLQRALGQGTQPGAQQAVQLLPAVTEAAPAQSQSHEQSTKTKTQTQTKTKTQTLAKSRVERAVGKPTEAAMRAVLHVDSTATAVEDTVATDGDDIASTVATVGSRSRRATKKGKGKGRGKRQKARHRSRGRSSGNPKGQLVLNTAAGAGAGAGMGVTGSVSPGGDNHSVGSSQSGGSAATPSSAHQWHTSASSTTASSRSSTVSAACEWDLASPGTMQAQPVAVLHTFLAQITARTSGQIRAPGMTGRLEQLFRTVLGHQRVPGPADDHAQAHARAQVTLAEAVANMYSAKVKAVGKTAGSSHAPQPSVDSVEALAPAPEPVVTPHTAALACKGDADADAATDAAGTADIVVVDAAVDVQAALVAEEPEAAEEKQDLAPAAVDADFAAGDAGHTAAEAAAEEKQEKQETEEAELKAEEADEANEAAEAELKAEEPEVHEHAAVAELQVDGLAMSDAGSSSTGSDSDGEPRAHGSPSSGSLAAKSWADMIEEEEEEAGDPFADDDDDDDDSDSYAADSDCDHKQAGPGTAGNGRRHRRSHSSGSLGTVTDLVATAHDSTATVSWKFGSAATASYSDALTSSRFFSVICVSAAGHTVKQATRCCSTLVMGLRNGSAYSVSVAICVGDQRGIAIAVPSPIIPHASCGLETIVTDQVLAACRALPAPVNHISSTIPASIAVRAGELGCQLMQLAFTKHADAATNALGYQGFRDLLSAANIVSPDSEGKHSDNANRNNTSTSTSTSTSSAGAALSPSHIKAIFARAAEAGGAGSKPCDGPATAVGLRGFCVGLAEVASSLPGAGPSASSSPRAAAPATSIASAEAAAAAAASPSHGSLAQTLRAAGMKLGCDSANPAQEARPSSLGTVLLKLSHTV